MQAVFIPPHIPVSIDRLSTNSSHLSRKGHHVIAFAGFSKASLMSSCRLERSHRSKSGCSGDRAAPAARRVEAVTDGVVTEHRIGIPQCLKNTLLRTHFVRRPSGPKLRFAAGSLAGSTANAYHICAPIALIGSAFPFGSLIFAAKASAAAINSMEFPEVLCIFGDHTGSFTKPHREGAF